MLLLKKCYMVTVTSGVPVPVGGRCLVAVVVEEWEGGAAALVTVAVVVVAMVAVGAAVAVVAVATLGTAPRIGEAGNKH